MNARTLSYQLNKNKKIMKKYSNSIQLQPMGIQDEWQIYDPHKHRQLPEIRVATE